MATQKLNTQVGNPRKGKSYSVSSLPDGRRVHTYADGRRVVVGGGGGGGQNPAQNTARMAADHASRQPPPAMNPAQRLAANPNAWQDSGYNSALASAQNQRSMGLTGLQTQGARASEDFATQMQRLQEAQSQSRQQTTSGANKQGLFYSGQLGKRLGDVDREFGRQNEDLNTVFRRGEQDRATQVGQLDQQAQQAQIGAALEAWDRFIAQGDSQVVAESALPPDLAALIASLSKNIGGA